MSDKPSFWDRLNWNPIVPGLLLGWWIWRLDRGGWEMGWFQWLGLAVMSIWMTGALVNLFTRGKFVEWINSSDEERPPELYDRFSEFEASVKERTPLIDALSRGMRREGDMEEILHELDLEHVEDGNDAVAFLTAYKQLCREDDGRAGELMELFRIPGSKEVFQLYFHLGMPVAHERLKQIAGRPSEESDLNREELKLLAILSGYAYRPAFPEIVRAARDPGLVESYMWGTIFDAGRADDEDFIELLRMVGNELPKGFACVAFLDRCNQLALKEDLDPHPFSSDAGVARLKEYLTDRDPEHFSYATSAATALPFLSHPGRDELISIASRHPEPNVAVESAWAGAKLGKREFIDRLAELTKDWKTGGRALEFLEELNLQDEIPAESLDPRHVARCRMADWLQHPAELGKLPDALEIVDHRRIFWPPCEEEREVTLLKWISGDDSGIGMTGGTTTWCFFFQEKAEEAPLDNYARHCNWEMRANEMEGAPEDYNDLDAGRELLESKNPGEDW